MPIVVTGATGALGQHVVRHLLDRGVAPTDVVAGGRDQERLAELAELGVTTARIDYDDPATLDAAFGAGDLVLLVSGSEVGARVAQHQRVVDAAARADVGLLAYTSILNADDNPVTLATDHRATEQALLASGLPYALLRNGWYLENYTDQVPTYLQTGVVLGAAGDGRIAAATRADFAEAAAAVLAAGPDVHAGRTYELGGEAFTLAELAETVTSATGQEVAHQDVPADELRAVLVDQAGLPAEVADMLVSADRAIAEGRLDTDTTDLQDLIGHRPTTMPEAIAAAT